jgi:hypothetical protein
LIDLGRSIKCRKINYAHNQQMQVTVMRLPIGSSRQGGSMALRDVLQALNDTNLVAAPTESRLAGEGIVAPDRLVEMQNDEASDAPMMVLSRINES